MASLLYLMGFFNTPPTTGPLEALSRETELHVTLMPAFSIPDRTLGQFQRSVEAVTRWFPEILCQPAGLAEFGEEGNKAPVVLYDPHSSSPHSLFNLHALLGDALRSCGGSYLDIYVNGKYTPHSSYGDARTSPALKTLTLIEHRGGFGEGMVALRTYGLLCESV